MIDQPENQSVTDERATAETQPLSELSSLQGSFGGGRPGNEVAVEAFDRHERVSVQYELDGVAMNAELLLAEGKITIDGRVSQLTALWAVQPGSSFDAPLPIAEHQYLLKHFLQQSVENPGIQIVDRGELLHALGQAENIHPELDDINAAVIVASPSGQSVFEATKRFFRALNNPADPLQIEIIHSSSAGVSPMETPVQEPRTILPFVRVSPLNAREAETPQLVGSRVVSECIGLGVLDANEVSQWTSVMNEVAALLESGDAVVRPSHITTIVFNALKDDPAAAKRFDGKSQELYVRVRELLGVEEEERSSQHSQKVQA